VGRGANQAPRLNVALEVVFRPQAEDEVLEVRQWYESKRVGLGREFGEELNRIVERIAVGPLQFPRVHGETRRAVLSRFPYAVYFRVADAAVVVLAIHGRQHPSHWQRRA
jgi:Plasmid stabilisation system protein.